MPSRIDLKCSVNHLFRPDNDNTHHTGMSSAGEDVCTSVHMTKE